MLALVYNDSSKSVRLDDAYLKPRPGQGEALIRILRAGICATVGCCPPPHGTASSLQGVQAGAYAACCGVFIVGHRNHPRIRSRLQPTPG